MIADVLSFSFGDTERLAEALETKWVRRVSGFYRCSLDEKGYFANLDWEPANLFYLECACDLYDVLMGSDMGVSFIGSDRRGMLFNEMARELEQLLVSSEKGWAGGVGPKNVFRCASCQQTMVREFFTLLGRLCFSKAGRKLLDSTCVFTHLSVIGSSKALDYLSRLVITSLVFTDKGFLSLNLIQIWTTTGNCSGTLRMYIHGLLLTLLRSDPAEFLRWGVNIVTNELLLEEFPSEPLLKLLEECVQDPLVLKTLLSKRPNITNIPASSHILVRMLAVTEGVEYLSAKNCVLPALDSWQNKDSVEYVKSVEKSLARALSSNKHRGSSPASSFPSPSTSASSSSSSSSTSLSSSSQLLQPIVVPMVDRAAARHCEASSSSSSSSSSSPSPFSPSSSSSSAAVVEAMVGSALFGGEAVDLEGLLRVPWNMEVKLSIQAAYATSGQPRDEYLRIDSFLGKSSHLRTNARCDVNVL